MKTNQVIFFIYLMAFAVYIAGCSKKLPLVTLHQIDLKHSQVNPFKITKYNEETCKLEVESLPSTSIANSPLHGAFCLTPDDFAKLKARAQAECRNKSK